MNATSLPALAVEAAPYVALQREMHDALLIQHPEWVERDGNCPTCDDYDRRFRLRRNRSQRRPQRRQRARSPYSSVRLFPYSDVISLAYPHCCHAIVTLLRGRGPD